MRLGRCTFRVPVLARYLSGAVLARLADEGARVGLVLLAVDRTGSAAFGGSLVAALMIPHVVAAPMAGALADHVRGRRLFHASLLIVYGTALVGIAWLTGRVSAFIVLAVAVVAGSFAPMVTGGLTGLLGELVPSGRRTRAFSLDSVSYNLAGIGGPALTAALATAFGPIAAVNMLGASACAGGLVLFSLPLATRPHIPGRRKLPRPRDLTEGLMAVLRDPVLRAVTAASSAGQIGIGALPLLAVLLAEQQHASWAVGGLMTAFAAGALCGSLCYARRPVGSDRPEHVVLLGLLATTVPLACVAAAPGPWPAAALFAAAGFCTGPLFSALLAARQRHAPASARSQVFTLGAGMKSAAAASGAAVAGALSGWGPTPLLLAAAACQMLAAGLGVVLLHNPRSQPKPTYLDSSQPAGAHRL